MITADGIGLLPVVDVQSLLFRSRQSAVDDANGDLLLLEHPMVVCIYKLYFPFVIAWLGIVRHFEGEPERIGGIGLE